MIERGFEKRNQERSKLATTCIELVISWSMWWWGVALSHGCRHIAEPRKSLGLALLCLFFVFSSFFILCRFKSSRTYRKNQQNTIAQVQHNVHFKKLSIINRFKLLLWFHCNPWQCRKVQLMQSRWIKIPLCYSCNRSCRPFFRIILSS